MDFATRSLQSLVQGVCSRLIKLHSSRRDDFDHLLLEGAQLFDLFLLLGFHDGLDYFASRLLHGSSFNLGPDLVTVLAALWLFILFFHFLFFYLLLLALRLLFQLSGSLLGLGLLLNRRRHPSLLGHFDAFEERVLRVQRTLLIVVNEFEGAAVLALEPQVDLAALLNVVLGLLQFGFGQDNFLVVSYELAHLLNGHAKCNHLGLVNLVLGRVFVAAVAVFGLVGFVAEEDGDATTVPLAQQFNHMTLRVHEQHKVEEEQNGRNGNVKPLELGSRLQIVTGEKDS